MALVPHNRYLRFVDGFALPPPAIATAYKKHCNWKDDEYAWYLARLALCMCVVPPVARTSVDSSGSQDASSMLDSSLPRTDMSPSRSRVELEAKEDDPPASTTRPAAAAAAVPVSSASPSPVPLPAAPPAEPVATGSPASMRSETSSPSNTMTTIVVAPADMSDLPVDFVLQAPPQPGVEPAARGERRGSGSSANSHRSHTPVEVAAAAQADEKDLVIALPAALDSPGHKVLPALGSPDDAVAAIVNAAAEHVIVERAAIPLLPPSPSGSSKSSHGSPSPVPPPELGLVPADTGSIPEPQPSDADASGVGSSGAPVVPADALPAPTVAASASASRAASVAGKSSDGVRSAEAVDVVDITPRASPVPIAASPARAQNHGDDAESKADFPAVTGADASASTVDTTATTDSIADAPAASRGAPSLETSLAATLRRPVMPSPGASLTRKRSHHPDDMALGDQYLPEAVCSCRLIIALLPRMIVLLRCTGHAPTDAVLSWTQAVCQCWGAVVLLQVHTSHNAEPVTQQHW